MLAVVACCSMMIFACGNKEVPEEPEKDLSGRTGNDNTGDEEEKDSVNIGFEAEGWKDTVYFNFEIIPGDTVEF